MGRVVNIHLSHPWRMEWVDEYFYLVNDKEDQLISILGGVKLYEATMYARDYIDALARFQTDLLRVVKEILPPEDTSCG